MAAILGLESWIYYSDFEQGFSGSYQVLKFKVLFTGKIIIACECT
jgi:hypothetical protein